MTISMGLSRICIGHILCFLCLFGQSRWKPILILYFVSLYTLQQFICTFYSLDAQSSHTPTCQALNDISESPASQYSWAKISHHDVYRHPKSVQFYQVWKNVTQFLLLYIPIYSIFIGSISLEQAILPCNRL